jgi:hypothetical protein
VATVTNKVFSTGTKLRTRAAGDICVFQDPTGTTKQFAIDLAGCTAGTLSVLDINATTAKTWTLQDVTGTLYQTGGTDVAVADGGTGASTAAAAATALGVGTGDSPQLTAVNVGHATDTTLSRNAAGVLQVEANVLYMASGTDVVVADGGTGASTLLANSVLLGNGTTAIANTGVGAANTVLRGTAAAPTFGTIDATYIDNRTRRVVIPIGCWDSNTKVMAGTEPDAVASVSMPTVSLTRTHIVFRVPSDYVSDAAMTLYWSMSGTSVTGITAAIYSKKLTPSSTLVTAAYDNTDDASFTPTGTAEQFLVVTTTISTSLAANDYVRLTVERDGADLNPNIARFLGGDFNYTADS